MKVSELCGVGSSSAAKGFKKDATQRDQIKQRQAKQAKRYVSHERQLYTVLHIVIV